MRHMSGGKQHVRSRPACSQLHQPFPWQHQLTAMGQALLLSVYSEG